MFTLYRTGFYSVSKVALALCEQELMLCCGAEIVPKRSQCEQKPYHSYNLQRSLLISKDHLPVQGSVVCLILLGEKCSDLTRTVSKIYPIRKFHFQQWSGAVLFRSRNCFETSVPSVNRSPIWYTFCNLPFHYSIQCEHYLTVVISNQMNSVLLMLQSIHLNLVSI